MLVKEVAADEAKAVLQSHWNGSFPVDVDSIARSLGIRVSRASLPEGTSGMILKRPGLDAQIMVERSDAPLRQRFTTAHELGHFVERTVVQSTPDDDFGFVDRRNAKTSDLHEFFANEFAANLLMPRDEVQRCSNAQMSVIAMAARFGVSVIAMKFRLDRLGLLA